MKGMPVMTMVFACVLACRAALLPAEGGPVQAISLLGVPLSWSADDAGAKIRCDQAQAAYETNPNEDNTVWYARRLGYIGEFQKALKVLDNGIEKFPNSYRLLRHRGHRLIAMRQFVPAIADFKMAAKLVAGKPLEIEPDGMPNRLNRPLSSTQFNIHYHLGLAYYLCADYTKAAEAYEQCQRWAVNNDLKVALADWRIISLQKLGHAAMAKKILKQIPRKMKLIENTSYHRRLLMYKGLIKPEELLALSPDGTEAENQLNLATQGYGVGNWLAQQGDREGARAIFLKIMKLKSWNAFGYIAAEADLMRMLPLAPQATAEDLLRAWQAFWNGYDLNALASLFVPSSRVSYYSSEKIGLIKGMAGLLEHHRGFGFVESGRVATQRLWLGDILQETAGGAGSCVLVTASWFFSKDCRNLAAVQTGPVTFLLEKWGENWLIRHAHFANWPAPQ